MTVRDALHQIVDSLSDEEAQDLLDLLNLRADPDELTTEELAEVRAIELAMKQGDEVSFEDWRHLRSR
jgi:hypothetical protein